MIFVFSGSETINYNKTIQSVAELVDKIPVNTEFFKLPRQTFTTQSAQNSARGT